MAKSLQEQLLAAGAIKKDRAAKLKKSKHKQNRQRQRGSAPEDEIKATAQQALREKAERDRELSRQRHAEAERRALAAQVRQLVEGHRIDSGDGATPYHYTDRGTVRTLHVTAAQQALLARGKLAIARLDDTHVLIPAPVAEKIGQRDETAIVALNSDTGDGDDEDDPYRDYVIPDDLDW